MHKVFVYTKLIKLSSVNKKKDLNRRGKGKEKKVKTFFKGILG